MYSELAITGQTDDVRLCRWAGVSSNANNRDAQHGRRGRAVLVATGLPGELLQIRSPTSVGRRDVDSTLQASSPCFQKFAPFPEPGVRIGCSILAGCKRVGLSWMRAEVGVSVPGSLAG